MIDDRKGASRRARLLRRYSGLLTIFATGVALAAWLLVEHAGRKTQAAGPSEQRVTVAQPLQRDVREWDAYTGRFEASRTVEVRPRVSGQVSEVNFRDGEIVKAGQRLFTIDPRPFEAALAEARAALAGARSDLALARANAARAARLTGDDAISRSDVDALEAKVDATLAAVGQGEAAVRRRALDLAFTQVRAPIAGMASYRRVDAGNQVAAGSAGTLLTTINVVDPIYFSFDSSESLFIKMKRIGTAGGAPLSVDIRLQDETSYPWHGVVDFTDNALDDRSGTIRIRATVSNPHLFLTPGMFGDLRLPMAGTQRVVLVPDTAISSDLTRKIVFVVGTGDVVAAHAVELGARVDGLRVIRSGLTPADRVVVSGVQLVKPGQKVQPLPGRIAAQPQAASETFSVPQAGAATMGVQ
ncbi:efflux RND transporter periplasmic adaptor subunit [Burkholderia sp. Ac-20379]|uniref:efflux RND transporter periplasmic adaptor subunit n=1 Tax=Burkholderia sp. Ac-20379 TaxID=2703900 RepID=UPI00197E8844|nr:efflux RND transporter periplasmic adaptor subunit [Burkholderia sp. Ac-20379]MBN3723685.1 efflux RND transporter periplasmic adaptor subunit [Burkholderia sp. Ac-20379]